MRLRPVAAMALSVLSVLLVAPAAGQQKFPYKAYVVADDVYVRSGPGKSYYPTSKLHSGDVVEVYRHDPGGWYAIRPPEGSFAWVSGRYLRVGRDDIAEVTAERVAARVGSQFSSIRDVIQVRLHKGELVEVLDSEEFGSGPGPGTWYKIAPPSGAFRWVHGKYVNPNASRPGVRKTSGASPLIDPQVSRRAAEAVASSAGESPIDETRYQASEVASEAAPDSQVRGTEHWEPVSEPAVQNDPPATGYDPRFYTNKFADPATDPDGSATLRRIAPGEFQAELDDINFELSIMLVEEPTVWSLDELGMRARSLLTQAETAVERGRARLLVRRIEQSQDIKMRYDAVHEMETEIERQNRRLSELDRQRRESRPPATAEQRFDGAGRLRRVVSSKVGAPQYALVDDGGGVNCFVTPAPGVNMQYYLGRRIGVTGIRGFIPDRGARHVTAKHVTPLEDRTVLR